MYAVVQGTVKAIGNFHQPFVQEGGTPYQRGGNHVASAK
ncbi:hypothetical protein ACIXEN_05195 [Bacteroides fragilis]